MSRHLIFWIGFLALALVLELIVGVSGGHTVSFTLVKPSIQGTVVTPATDLSALTGKTATVTTEAPEYSPGVKEIAGIMPILFVAVLMLTTVGAMGSIGGKD